LGRALAWLRTQQQADGGFGSGSTTADAVYAIAVAGQNPASESWSTNGISALDALANIASVYARNDAGQVGKVLRAVIAAHADPTDFGGVDLIATLQGLYDTNTGWYHSGSLFRHALAVEGLAMAGVGVPNAAIEAILSEQKPTGGWGWPIGGTSEDVDTTGRVLTTLRVAGLPITHTAFLSATTRLTALQGADGGWPAYPGATFSNANSTALAIHGLLAAGINPQAAPFVSSSHSPLAALLSFQEGSGAFAYSRDWSESRLLATLDAIPVLAAFFPDDPVLNEQRFLPLLVQAM